MDDGWMVPWPIRNELRPSYSQVAFHSIPFVFSQANPSLDFPPGVPKGWKTGCLCGSFGGSGGIGTGAGGSGFAGMTGVLRLMSSEIPDRSPCIFFLHRSGGLGLGSRHSIRSILQY